MSTVRPLVVHHLGHGVLERNIGTLLTGGFWRLCFARPCFGRSFRERKLNPNFFFSNCSGAPGISRQNPGISCPKSLISLVSRDVSNFLAPTRSRGRPLPHWKISGPKSLGLGSFSVPDHCYDEIKTNHESWWRQLKGLPTDTNTLASYGNRRNYKPGESCAQSTAFPGAAKRG